GIVLLHEGHQEQGQKNGSVHVDSPFTRTPPRASNVRMGMVVASLILLLQSDPKDRLFDAIRESSVEAAQKALAELALGDGAKAARAVMAALPGPASGSTRSSPPPSGRARTTRRRTPRSDSTSTKRS